MSAPSLHRRAYEKLPKRQQIGYLTAMAIVLSSIGYLWLVG